MTTTAEAPPNEDYQALLERVFDGRVKKWTAEAEDTERFPRAVSYTHLTLPTILLV